MFGYHPESKLRSHVFLLAISIHKKISDWPLIAIGRPKNGNEPNLKQKMLLYFYYMLLLVMFTSLLSISTSNLL